MGIVQRQGFQNTIITYLGVFLGFLNGYLLYTKYLEPDELGLVSLLPFLAILYIQFASLGYAGIVFRYFPYFKDRSRGHHGFLFWAIAITFVAFLIFTLIFLLLEPLIIKAYSEKSALLVEYFLYIIPMALSALWLMILENYLAGLYKTVVPSLVREIFLRLGNTIAISLVALDIISFKSFILLFIAINFLAVLILLSYTIYLKQFTFRPSISFRMKKLARQMAIYGGFVMLNSTNSYAYQLIDTLMLAAYINLDVVGIYVIMLFILKFITIPSRSMYKTVYPLIGEHWKNKALDEIGILYKKVSIVNLVLGGFVFMGIVINLETLLSPPMLPERFLAGYWVVIIIGCGRLYDLAAGINNIIIITSTFYRYNTLFMVFLTLLAIVTNYIFIPLYGLIGAAIATTITIALINTIQLIFVWVKFKLQPFSGKTILILAITGLVIMVGIYIPKVDFFIWDILIRSSICSILYFTLVLTFKISPDAWNFAKKLLKQVGLEKFLKRF